MRGENIVQMWIEGRAVGTARPFTTFMYMDKFGKRRVWKKDDPVGRLRSTIVTSTFVSKSKSGMEDAIRLTAIQACNERRLSRGYTGPVIVDICFQFAYNMSDTGAVKDRKMSRVEPMVKKPDIDNAMKMVYDNMTGIIYKDDNQVIGGMNVKTYGPKSGIRVAVWKADTAHMTENLKEIFTDGIEPHQPIGGMFKQ